MLHISLLERSAIIFFAFVLNFGVLNQSMATTITAVGLDWPNGTIDVSLPVNGVNQTFVIDTGSSFSAMSTGAASASGLLNSGATISLNNPGPQLIPIYSGVLGGVSAAFGITDAFLGTSGAQGIIGMDILGVQGFTLSSSTLNFGGIDYPVTDITDPGYQVTIPVNGKNVTFVVDTGADVSTISTATAKGLGLTNTGKTETAEGVGGSQTFQIETGDLNALGKKTFDVGTLPDNVAGLLGNDVLDKNFVIAWTKNGKGTLTIGDQSFSITEIPEPATLTMMMTALCILGATMGRFRKRKIKHAIA